MAALTAEVEAVDTFLVRVPLPEPIQAPGIEVSEREFVLARVHAGGEIGTGFGLTRGAGIDAVIAEQVAPLVVGRPAGAIRQIWSAARRSVWMLGECGIFARALSVVDIALWDLQGRLLGAPLWRLLGGHCAEVPCMAIMGYYRKVDSVEVVRVEAERLVKAGYRAFKMPVGLDLDLDRRRLSALRAVVGPTPRVAVDAAGAFRSPKEVVRAWRLLEEFDIEFLEDPLPAPAWRQTLRLAQSAPFKIAFGESVVALDTLGRLAGGDGVDILRLDVTAHLGVTGFILLASMALENWRQVFPHYFPDLHASLAGALGGIEVEESPREADTVGFWRLRAAQPAIREGIWHLTERPGFGIEWDEDALARYRVRTECP
jgi:L-alanine-DL-glutamate epimerase-like enolase superfamily enzyme